MISVRVILNCSCGVQLEFSSEERDEIEQVKAAHRAQGHTLQESGGVKRDSILVANRQFKYGHNGWHG